MDTAGVSPGRLHRGASTTACSQPSSPATVWCLTQTLPSCLPTTAIWASTSPFPCAEGESGGALVTGHTKEFSSFKAHIRSCHLLAVFDRVHWLRFADEPPSFLVTSTYSLKCSALPIYQNEECQSEKWMAVTQIKGSKIYQRERERERERDLTVLWCK